MLPVTGTASINDLRAQAYITNDKYARHRGKLLRKAAPKYYQVRGCRKTYFKCVCWSFILVSF